MKTISSRIVLKQMSSYNMFEKRKENNSKDMDVEDEEE